MDHFEYLTGYLLKEHAKDINIVVDFLNRYADDGWRFTGYTKEVKNGTFFMFERRKES